MQKTYSHAEAREVFRRAGIPKDRIDEVLRQFPDPLDTERDSGAFAELGITPQKLMDLMGLSP